MRFCYLIFYAFISLVGISKCKTDDSPGFFLKITKNVPRLGKRSDKDFESSFLKNFKTIPRIGRSAENNNNDFSSLESWLNEQSYLKKLNKRVLMHPARISSAESELSVVQPVNANTLIELLEKDAFPSDNVKFVHWKDFDLALQLDMDLYGKVISLGRRPDQRLKQDLNIGSYTPLFSRVPGGTDRDNFMLYDRAADMDGTFSSNVLGFNGI